MIQLGRFGPAVGWGLARASLLALFCFQIIGCASTDVRSFREGQVHAQNGKPDEAIQAYLTALEANPGLVEARLNLGSLLYKQGKLAQAEREFRVLLSQDPEHAVARENLAITLEAKGGVEEEAYQQWRLAMINESRSEWKVYGKQSIERLEEKIRAAAEDVGVSQSDVDTTLPKFAVTPRPQNIALVIGIEKYQRLIPARYARADAERVAKYLYELGYAPRNVEVLINERATEAQIRLALERWVSERVQADSRVLIYYSGHGSINPVTGETYLVPHDGDASYLSNTAYPTKMLYAKLAELKAKQVVVVLDSCFSGQGGRSVLMEGVRPAVAKIEDPVLASPRLAVLAAAEGSQISTMSKNKQHGLFTYYLLKALLEGQRDLAAIYDYVSPKVQDEAKLLNGQQVPNLRPGSEQVRGKFTLWDKQ